MVNIHLFSRQVLPCMHIICEQSLIALWNYHTHKLWHQQCETSEENPNKASNGHFLNTSYQASHHLKGEITSVGCELLAIVLNWMIR